MRFFNSNQLTASLLTRGESAVAWLGLVGTALMISAVAAGGWWTLVSTRRATVDGRERELTAISTLLGDAARPMIENGRLSELRTLMTATAARHELGTLSLSIGGGPTGEGPDRMVIADASPRSTGYSTVPEIWPGGPLESQGTRVSRLGEANRTVLIELPVVVASKGVAMLTVGDGIAPGLIGEWSVLAGIGAIGVCGMTAVLIAYRTARKRLRAMGAIREALRALHAGEADPTVLTVSERFGPEAKEWNALLLEMSGVRKRAAIEKAGGSLGGERRRRDGDLTSLCDGLWQGLVLIDEQLRVRYANGAGAVFLRKDREQLVGGDLATCVTDPAALAAIRAVAGGTTRSRTVVELAQDEPDGGRTVLRLTVRPVRKDDSATALLVIEDVTQQRIADESRQAFVATATHELRTPLTNIRLYVDTMLEDPEQDASRRATGMNVISTEVRRLERMVGDMLSVAQIEAGQLKLHRGEVALEPIFEELRGDFAQQAGQKEITLKFDLPPKWPQMEGDRDKIVMALHNLVGNAIKYTPAGGQVLVRVTTEGTALLVDVADNGIGIKPEEQGLVFEKFYRAKDRRIAGVTGTGLGLAIAREVVRLHGGEITLESTVDKGSTFRMMLPSKAA